MSKIKIKYFDDISIIDEDYSDKVPKNLNNFRSRVKEKERVEFKFSPKSGN